ncbi:MAG: hypothetical protein HOF50_01800 [Candidatus Marinimicrobia bacterium]|jgi:hypothetical protein|nr:hypothetical protein [Candidatus Neomarinimicrobiota bacterium]MBT3838654.1 hypothetical protein [Candidatus Neomarinimicrobiota bacterium]
MKNNIPKIILILSCFTLIFSQSISGAIFLLIPPSPTMNGLGGIGVCLPSDDPYSGYFNPANGLNYFEGTSYSHSKMGTPWLQSLADDLDYEVWNLGILPKKYPVKFVFSFHKTFLDLGEQFRVDEFGNIIDAFKSHMKSDALTIGMGYTGQLKNIPFDFSFGYTRKTAIQNFAENGKSSNELNDYGFLFSLPFSFTKSSIKKLKPFDDAFDFDIKPSFGYSVSNIGEEIVFNDPEQADPTPKYLRIGISSTAILSYKSKWNLLEWNGGRSASDELAEPRYNNDDPIKYQSGLGDVDFFKNVLKSKSDSLITIHRGDEWTILDIYIFRKGRKTDVTGKIALHTSGYGYRLSGVFKILYYLLEDPIFEIIPEFIDVQYNYSKWEQELGHPLHDTEFESLSISFNNLDRLLMGILK